MRKKIDPNQTPRQRFVRLGNARVNLILKRLNVLANLADRRRYEFSVKDVDLMEKSLRDRLDYIIRKFREHSQESKHGDEFRFE